MSNYCAAYPDRRGSNKTRYARKTWLLTTPEFGGDGVTVKCVHCKAELTREILQADRIVPGGLYSHDNIQPSCRRCNLSRGKKVDWKYGE